MRVKLGEMHADIVNSEGGVYNLQSISATHAMKVYYSGLVHETSIVPG